jgi:hypothetical protein
MLIAKAVIKYADGCRKDALDASFKLCEVHQVMQGVDIFLFEDDTTLYIGDDEMVYNYNSYPLTR